MKRVAVFFDAGYVRSLAAFEHDSDSWAVRLNARAVADWARYVASDLCDAPRSAAVPVDTPFSDPLLRIYWYDAAWDPSDDRYGPQRRYTDAIASTPRVRVRLGRLVQQGKRMTQKGVDVRLALDLVRYASEVYDVAIVVSGDSDLTEAVTMAQDRGALVCVAAATVSEHSDANPWPRRPGEEPTLATDLRQAADMIYPLSPSWVREATWTSN